jgi:hypothetical protein
MGKFKRFINSLKSEGIEFKHHESRFNDSKLVFHHIYVKECDFGRVKEFENEFYRIVHGSNKKTNALISIHKMD